MLFKMKTHLWLNMATVIFLAAASFLGASANARPAQDGDEARADRGQVAQSDPCRGRRC
jgi:hypothetical protein